MSHSSDSEPVLADKEIDDVESLAKEPRLDADDAGGIDGSGSDELKGPNADAGEAALEPVLADKEIDGAELLVKKPKLDADDAGGIDGGSDELKAPNVDPGEAASSETSVYEKFTRFDYLDEKESFNVGTFGVHSCNHVPYGELAGLTSPVTNFVLIDGQKKKGLFTVYGKNAINWKETVADEVVHLENFSWRRDFSDKSHFHDIKLDHCGFLHDESILEVLPDLSKNFLEQRAKEVNHVFSSTEIKEQWNRVVLIMKAKLPPTTGKRKSDNTILHMRACMFSTSDDVPVKITAFENQIAIFDSLEENKVYLVENLHEAAPSNYTMTHICFNVAKHTTFKLTNVKLPIATEKKIDSPAQPAIKATLKDLTTADSSLIYESEVFVRQQSTKCANGYQAVVFDYEENRDAQMSAMVKFEDDLHLKRGQRIMIKYQAKKNWDTKDLIVARGSMQILPDPLSFPMDKIDTLKFQRI